MIKCDRIGAGICIFCNIENHREQFACSGKIFSCKVVAEADAVVSVIGDRGGGIGRRQFRIVADLFECQHIGIPVRIHDTDRIAGVDVRTNRNLDFETGCDIGVRTLYGDLHIGFFGQCDRAGSEFRLHLVELRIINTGIRQRDGVITGLCAFRDLEFQHKECAGSGKGILCEVVAERKTAASARAVRFCRIIFRRTLGIIDDIGQDQRAAVPCDVDGACCIACIGFGCNRHREAIVLYAFDRTGFCRKDKICCGKCLKRCCCQHDCCG